MTPRRSSLSRRLTTRLIGLQVVTLMTFALCMPLLQVIKGETRTDALDPKISSAIVSTLAPSAGELVVTLNDKLQALLVEAPSLWFIALDNEERRATFGPVPPSMAALSGSVPLLDRAQFARVDASGGEALLTRERLASGEVRLLFGNGPRIGLWRALARSAADSLGPLAVIFMVLACATSLLTPRAVGSALAGMRRVVRRASLIDIDRRGTRLPTTDVPAEIAPLVDAVNDALRRIDDGYERQQRFLANAAHELRTPIAILQNRIELLAGDAARSGFRLDRLLLDVQRVANLAEQLLDLQRLDFGKAKRDSLDLVQIAKRVVADLAPLMIEAGYVPQLSTSAASVVVQGDASAIERALINLVQNAVAHGGNQGSISVEVAGGCVAVADDGPGVPLAQREQIFEPFHRLRSKASGAGLGLALVREIMSRHQGSVVVETSRSGGACFTLRFAAQSSAAPGTGLAEAA